MWHGDKCMTGQLGEAPLGSSPVSAGTLGQRLPCGVGGKLDLREAA